MTGPSIPSQLPATAVPALADTPVQPAREMDPAQRAKLEKASVQFEGLFIHQMLKEMRRSTEEIAGDDPLFKGQSKGQSGNGLLDLADTMLADVMAGQHAFGIADTILRQMLPAGGSGSAPLKFRDPRVALPLGERNEARSSSTLDHQGPAP